MTIFRHTSQNHAPLQDNHQHLNGMRHATRLYNNSSIYSFIPKNSCSAMRLSVVVANGCIDDLKDGNWIHKNNQTFMPTFADAV
jgi:hypothetical protein